MAIALLERRSALEAVAQHSSHADSTPSEADAKLEAQVGARFCSSARVTVTTEEHRCS